MIEKFKEAHKHYDVHNVDFKEILRFVLECESASDSELDAVKEHGLFFDTSIDGNEITAWRDGEHMVKDFKIKDNTMETVTDICSFIIKYNYQDND